MIYLFYDELVMSFPHIYLTLTYLLLFDYVRQRVSLHVLIENMNIVIENSTQYIIYLSFFKVWTDANGSLSNLNGERIPYICLKVGRLLLLQGTHDVKVKG